MSIEFKLVQEFVVDRKTWLRGEGYENSSLLRGSDQKQCCVGFLMEQSGIPRDLLLESGQPHGLSNKLVSDAAGCSRYAFESETRCALDRLHSKFLRNPELTEHGTLDELEATSIYNANDDPKLSDETREERLTKLFAARGITVRFEGGENSAQ